MAGVLLFAAGVIFFAIIFKLLGITVRSCVQFVRILMHGDNWAVTIAAVAAVGIVLCWFG